MQREADLQPCVPIEGGNRLQRGSKPPLPDFAPGLRYRRMNVWKGRSIAVRSPLARLRAAFADQPFICDAISFGRRERRSEGVGFVRA